DADWRDVEACYPRQSQYPKGDRSTFAGLWPPASLVAWRGAPTYTLQYGYGLSTSSRIATCAVRKTGRLPRANVSWSRPSKTGGNSCRRAQDVDGPRYGGRSTSAPSALACGLPSITMVM